MNTSLYRVLLGVLERHDGIGLDSADGRDEVAFAVTSAALDYMNNKIAALFTSAEFAACARGEPETN